MEVRVKFMEPFEKDELKDRELDGMLRQWRSREVPARLREAVFPRPSRPWWRGMWTTSIRVPVPLMCALVLALVLAAAASLRPRPEPAIRTVVKKSPESPIVWVPVSEFRPRIIRSE
jgi:hypothetical protein